MKINEINIENKEDLRDVSGWCDPFLSEKLRH